MELPPATQHLPVGPCLNLVDHLESIGIAVAKLRRRHVVGVGILGCVWDDVNAFKCYDNQVGGT